MVLLRKVIGDALRARRQAQHRTLREVSTAANVSLGYLSEIERGHKEASSELLASICDALGAPLSQMLTDVSATFALAEQMEDAFSPEGAAALAASLDNHATGDLTADMAGDSAMTDGEVTVQVHSAGPLKTVLTSKRVPPGQRHNESVFAA